MQPPHSSTFPDLYSRQQTSQFYSHFPPQNPNPNPYSLQIEPHCTTNLNPPGVDAYLHSFPITNPPSFTFSHPIPYVSDLVAPNWAPEEAVPPYGNSLYAVSATVTQDVSQQLQPSIAAPSTWPNSNTAVKSHGHWKKIPKKTKIVQSVWCEICKIACNSGEVLSKHKQGRKHKKNVEKLISSASVATTSTSITNPVIGPPEKPKTASSGIKKKAGTPKNLEIKRMKVLQGGAAANAVRTCTICNVVCNSDTVFKFHLAGQKHASMVKTLQQGGVV